MATGLVVLRTTLEFAHLKLRAYPMWGLAPPSIYLALLAAHEKESCAEHNPTEEGLAEPNPAK